MNPIAKGALFIAAALLPSLLDASERVLLSTTTLLPGETLRVVVRGDSSQKFHAQFLGKNYPFYSIGPDASRALIGIPLDLVPARYPLAIRGAETNAPWDERFEVEIATKVFIVENVNFSKAKTALMMAERREGRIISAAKRYLSRDQQWESFFIFPVEGPTIGEFGIKRLRNGNIPAGFHKGIDLRAAKGTPLLAANSGTVMLASNFKAHGKTVLLNHGQGVMSIYLHLDSIAVAVRQSVRKGQEIGRVGSTGLSTAPHVHFQIYVHGVPVDPKPWTEAEF